MLDFYPVANLPPFLNNIRLVVFGKATCSATKPCFTQTPLEPGVITWHGSGQWERRQTFSGRLHLMTKNTKPLMSFSLLSWRNAEVVPGGTETILQLWKQTPYAKDGQAERQELGYSCHTSLVQPALNLSVLDKLTLNCLSHLIEFFYSFTWRKFLTAT